MCLQCIAMNIGVNSMWTVSKRYHFLLAMGLVLLSIPALHAQSILHGIGVRALSGRVEPWTSVDIRMTDNGASLIWWGVDGNMWMTGGAWLRADGTDIDRPLPPFNKVDRVLAVRDTSWVGLQYRRADSFPGLFDIFLCNGHGSTIRDTLAFVTTVGWTTFNDLEAEFDALFSAIEWNQEAIHFLCESRGRSWNIGVVSGAISGRYIKWRVGSATTTSILTMRAEGIPDSLESIRNLLTHDLLRAAAVKETTVSIYQRRGGGRTSIYLPDSVYTESVLLIDLRTGGVIDSCTLDSVPRDGLNRTPRILPPSNGTVDIIRNNTANTALLADRYALNGTHLGQFLLTDLIVLEAPIPAFHFGTIRSDDELSTISGMDYDILALDDDSRLLAWTMPNDGGGTDCFIRLFDRNWNPVGYVKRIHEDTTGNQYHPVLAAKGDTLAVSWKSNRGQSSYDSLFIRFFLQDHILDVEEEADTPSGVQIVSLWPQPARERFVMEVNVPFQEASVTLECRDLLGRLLFRDERSTTKGRIRFHRNVSRLQPGLYLLSVRSGDQTAIRKLLVE
jgi:hypothetical protein